MGSSPPPVSGKALELGELRWSQGFDAHQILKEVGAEAFRDQRTWAALARRGMAQDFSWARSAARYEALYDQLLR